MRTVVLVGTDHKFQKHTDGPHRAGIESFRNTIRKLIDQHDVCAIAEEMYPAALKKGEESVAKEMCTEVGRLLHNFSDPALGNERRTLGIRDDSEIEIEGSNNNWTPEQIAAAQANNTQLSYRIREREWLRRIQVFDKWPLLFICGSNHFSHFAKLLRENEIDVIKAYQDWGPAIEVISPTPLYSEDTYPAHAQPSHCLSKLKRITKRQLLPDEKVTVKGTACGKDFWAFEIEIDDGTEGWVLNEDGGINITFPNP